MGLPVTGTSNLDLVICKDIAVTGVQPSQSIFGYGANDTTYQATVSGTGAVTATVQIEVSNDNVGWLYDSTSTLSLTGTTVASGGFTSNAQWKYIRANITAISGANAKVTVTVGG